MANIVFVFVFVCYVCVCVCVCVFFLYVHGSFLGVHDFLLEGDSGSEIISTLISKECKDWATGKSILYAELFTHLAAYTVFPWIHQGKEGGVCVCV